LPTPAIRSEESVTEVLLNPPPVKKEALYFWPICAITCDVVMMFVGLWKLLFEYLTTKLSDRRRKRPVGCNSR
jgi:hypothetical protein